MRDLLNVMQLMTDGHIEIAICFLGGLEFEPDTPEERLANALAEIALNNL